ncbi:hypothetical protein FBEOM_7735 [Fusarium beomiforme]|uniref:F-box domain-containing protein n=1 Tax=Fusarium beomiforme TaxID=44412 RepID=A0A9P5DUY3_9HYPO|nr:hypothetical protein FBEOM_7735 [Fusarium beomiforme]
MECYIVKLPDEVLVDVAKRLPGKAIKAVRASCTKLNRIASSYLFPVLYISCHQLDLDVFRLVTSNPLLAGGVKELVIDDTTLSPRLADWDIYRAVASYPHLWPKRKKAYVWNSKFDEEGRVWSDEPDREFYALYKTVLRGHHENRRARADITALKQAIPLFKSLRSLVISNRTADDDMVGSGAQSEESSSPVVKMWKRLGESKRERPPFPPRCDWISPWNEPGYRAEVMELDWFNDQLDQAIEEIGWPTPAGDADMIVDWGPQSRVAEDTSGNSEAPMVSATRRRDYYNYLIEDGSLHRIVGGEARALFVALEVLENPSIRLTEFRVDASLEVLDETYQPGLPIFIFDSRESPFPERLSSSFSAASNLTKFHLVLSNDFDIGTGDHIGEVTMKEGQLAQAFASMPLLEDLLLEPHGMSIFTAIPSDIKFDRLRHLELSCGQIDPQKLVRFIEQHGATLKTLSIQSCCIDPSVFDTSWEEVLTEIRKLQDAEILKIYDGEVIGLYDDSSTPGCWKNSTLNTPRFLFRHWEFVCFSWWRQHHEYPWDISSDDGSGDDQGDGDDGDDEDVGSDEDAVSDEDGGSEDSENE